MITPSEVSSIEYECNCTGISDWKWEELMEGATRADKSKIDAIVKRDLPDLYNDLCLQFYNPYNYFKTDKHLILVHSSIEYFLKYEP